MDVSKALFGQELGSNLDLETAKLEHTSQGVCFECSSEKTPKVALDSSGMHQGNFAPIGVVADVRERMLSKDLVEKVEKILREEESIPNGPNRS